MDPYANISEQRALAQKILDSDKSLGEPIAAHRLAELVDALDEWRNRGGFDPYDPQERELHELQQRIAEVEQDFPADPTAAPSEALMSKLVQASMHAKKLVERAEKGAWGEEFIGRVSAERQRIRALLSGEGALPDANLRRQSEIVARMKQIEHMPAPAGQSMMSETIEMCQLGWELARLLDPEEPNA